MRKLLLTLACVTGMVVCNQAKAITYGFDLIPGTQNGNPLLLGLTVDITQGAGNTVFFKFSNSAQVSSRITEIYFEGAETGYPSFDGYLSSPSIYAQSSGVNYNVVAGTGRPPGGQNLTPPWMNNHTWLVADNTSNANGIDVGEWLTVQFTLDQSFSALIGHLDSQLPPRIAEHIQSIALLGNSSSYVVDGRVPDGGTTAALLGVGLVGIGFLARRKA